MQEFGPDDQDIAVELYERLENPRDRAVLDFLVEHPDERLHAREIMEQIGLAEHADVARAMYRIGEIAGSLGRKRPWGESQNGYLLAGEIAALLKRGRERVAH